MPPDLALQTAKHATCRLRHVRRRLAAGRPVDRTALAETQSAVREAIDSLSGATERRHVDALLRLDRTFREVADLLSEACSCDPHRPAPGAAAEIPQGRKTR